MAGTQIFSLFGSIMVDNAEANRSLLTTDKNAKSVANTFSAGVKSVGRWGVNFTKTVKNAGTAIIDMAKETSDAADNIDKMSQKIGISREAYQELTFAFSQSGTDIDVMKTGMRSLVSQTGNVTAALNALGVEMEDESGKTKTQEELFYDVVRALQSVENSTDKAKLANQLFGRAGSELMPILNAEVGSLDDLRNSAHEAGLVLSDDIINNGVKMKDTIDKFEKSTDAIKDKLASVFLPAVTDTFDGITEMLNGRWNEGVIKAGDGLISVFEAALTTIDGLFGTHTAQWYQTVVQGQQDYGKQIQQTVAYWTGNGNFKADEIESKYGNMYNDLLKQSNRLIVDKGWTDANQILEQVFTEVVKNDEMAYLAMNKGYVDEVRSYIVNILKDRGVGASATHSGGGGYFGTPHLASGGLAYAPTMAIVGDNVNARNNPEVIAPLDRLSGMIADALRDVLGSNSRDIVLAIDGNEFGRVAIDSINSLSRQSGGNLRLGV